MAVIINEFEVVVEPPATAPTVEGEGSEAEPQARVLSPYEVGQLMRHALDRQLRVAAD